MGGGGSNPPKSRNYLFLGKIFKFQGGGGVRTPGPLLWIHACKKKLGFVGVYLIFLLTCGFSLEPPRHLRGGSNVYPHCMFLEKIDL